MQTFDIICLAKSTKHGGICIAGMKTDGSGWLRPVSNKSDGTLYPEHYTIRDGLEPHLFDIIRIPVMRHEPKFYQPENWVIVPNKSWEIIGTPAKNQIQQLLIPEIEKHSSAEELLGNLSHNFNYEDLKNVPVHSSLALIKPHKIEWKITSYDNNKKFKAIFLLNKTLYTLPITDPIWIAKLNSLEEGIYSCKEVIEKLNLENFEADKFRLTISLSEPYQPPGQEEKFCYKLVASVINVTDISQRLGW